MTSHKLYEDYAMEYDSLYSNFYYIRKSNRISQKSKGKDLLLDVGCGSGRLNEYLGDDFDKVVPIDISMVFLEIVRQNSDNCIRADMSNIPINGGSADCVSMIGEVVCYSENLKNTFEEVYRLLKQDGCFIFDFFEKPESSIECNLWGGSVHANYNLEVLNEEELRVEYDFTRNGEDIGSCSTDLRYYEQNKVNELLEDIGFSDVEVLDKTRNAIFMSARK